MTRLLASVLLVVGTASFLLATTEESIRTDLITRTVLAINASFQRSIAACKNDCPAAVVESVKGMQFESVMSPEGKELVSKLKTTFDVDWDPVQDWLNRLKNIQKIYFESVLKYRDRDSVPIKEALFFLDIGAIHNATTELLANQKELMFVVADLSAILEIVQRGRSGLALKLAFQLGDLTPYHETFGCAHNVSGGDGTTDCAAVMRSSFKRSFHNLQETLKKFFIEEMPESELLGDDEDVSNEEL